MAQRTDAQLITEATVIRNETGVEANTAVRVGDMLLDLIGSKAHTSSINTQNLQSVTTLGNETSRSIWMTKTGSADGYWLGQKYTDPTVPNTLITTTPSSNYNDFTIASGEYTHNGNIENHLYLESLPGETLFSVNHNPNPTSGESSMLVQNINGEDIGIKYSNQTHESSIRLIDSNGAENLIETSGSAYSPTIKVSSIKTDDLIAASDGTGTAAVIRFGGLNTSGRFNPTAWTNLSFMAIELNGVNWYIPLFPAGHIE